MKILSYLVLCLLVAVSAIAGTDVTLKWDANSEANLVGYKVYRSEVSGQYGESIDKVLCGHDDSTCCTYTDKNVPDGKWYWVVTAYDSNGQGSMFSNEVTDTLDSEPPAPPQNLTIWQKILSFLKSIFGWG